MSPIPEFKQSGVLPPYTMSNPGQRGPNNAGISPHPATIAELVAQLGTSDERKRILLGFLRFRAALRACGLPLAGGFMWLDGSFCEELTDREPGDIDLITFLEQPSDEVLREMTEPVFWVRVHQAQALFRKSEPKDHPNSVWSRYRCDAFLVWLQREAPAALMRDVVYWYGLFSHRRGTNEWKGMVRVELAEEPGEAALIAQLEAEIGEVTR